MTKTSKNTKKKKKQSERQIKGHLYSDLRKIDTNEYVSNQQFYEEMVKSKQLGELTPQAVDCFVLLANKAIRSFHYSDKMDKDDCLSNSYHDFVKYGLNNFNPERTNAVAYFSSLAFAGFMKGWNKLKPKKLKSIRYVISLYGEIQYATYDEEDAQTYLESLRSFHEGQEKYITLESYSVSKTVSMDGVMDDSEKGIYNL